MPAKLQCAATYMLPNGNLGAFGCQTFYCLLEPGHSGQHKDWQGNWPIFVKDVKAVDVPEHLPVRSE
jgi:hypothetical protein